MLLSEKKLGQVLVTEGSLTEKQLINACDRQILKQISLKEAIIDLEYLKEDGIMGAIINHFGFTYLSLQDYPIDQNLVDKIPESKCRQYKLIPVSLVSDLITVATSDPLNIIALDDIALLTNCEVMPVMSTEQEIEEAINRYYGKQISLDKILSKKEEDFEIKRQEEKIDVTSSTQETKIDEVPIIKLANQTIATAIRKKASDIHIEPREKFIGVRYRLDGVLVEEESLPKSIQAMLISRFKIMAKMDIAEHRLPQDGRIKIVFENRPVDLRVSSLPTSHGEKIVVRILDRGTLRTELDDLGFEEKILSEFRRCIELPYGLILATGPTGSGKTTTLYAALSYLNNPDTNIVTVEDPIEYELAQVNQVQVNADAGLTFVNALKFILRQDPDIIMIGEIRDKETLNMATKGALTGHLVFSTLHTNDAPGAVTRLLDMGGEPYLIASSLELVVAQRLLRRLCEDCKEAYPLTQDLMHYFEGIELKPEQLFKPQGCSKCNNRGMRGRTAAHELMRLTEPLRGLITASSPANIIKQKAVELGMKTLRQSAFEKVAQGIISVEEALEETT